MFLINSQLGLRKKRSAVIHFTSVAMSKIVVCGGDVSLGRRRALVSDTPLLILLSSSLKCHNFDTFFSYEILKLLLNVSEWKWHSAFVVLFHLEFMWFEMDVVQMVRECTFTQNPRYTSRGTHQCCSVLSWMFLSCRCWLFHHANKTFDWIKNVFEIKKWTTIISHVDPTKIVLELVFVARHKFLF